MLVVQAQGVDGTWTLTTTDIKVRCLRSSLTNCYRGIVINNQGCSLFVSAFKLNTSPEGLTDSTRAHCCLKIVFSDF